MYINICLCINTYTHNLEMVSDFFPNRNMFGIFFLLPFLTSKYLWDSHFSHTIVPNI